MTSDAPPWPALIVVAIALLIYFLPSIIAVSRRHNNSAAIFALNLVLGWTLLGWVAALVWSLIHGSVVRPVIQHEVSRGRREPIF